MSELNEVMRPGRSLPNVGITMGDAAGIGPEIILRSLSENRDQLNCRPIVIGDFGLLRRAAHNLGIDAEFSIFESGGNISSQAIGVVDLANLPRDLEPGVESPEAGKAAGEFIERSVELWRQGSIDAICTAPINKRSLELGGYDFPGHTEFLAALTDTPEFAMSFFAGDLRVVLLSTHLSLADAIAKVKTEPLAKLIRFSHLQLSKLFGKTPRIAVAGLNPHASESGKFGSEERLEIEPAIRQCLSEGIDVSGPFSPDTIFLRGFRGEFDAVIACYHDQATIAVKCLSFGSAVNVTLGLPLIRTSVDHGTAFDIAGKGIADASSMTAAIMLASELAAAKRNEAKAPQGSKL